MSVSVGPLLGGGIALIVPSLRPEMAPHAEALRLLGVSGIAVSVGIWFCLWLTADKPAQSVERGFISVPDAGDWLYRRGSPTLRTWLNQFVPDTFNSVRDHATASQLAALRA